MKVDLPLNNPNQKPHHNFPQENNQETKDSFGKILLNKISLLSKSHSNVDVNYNRQISIGSEALSFLETPLLGSTSIDNDKPRNFPGQDEDGGFSSKLEASLAQFSVELEQITSEIDDVQLDIEFTDSRIVTSTYLSTIVNEAIAGQKPYVIPGGGNHTDLINTVKPYNKIDNNLTSLVSGKNVPKQPNKHSSAQFSEIAAKVFQDDAGIRLILKTGQLTEKGRIDLEDKITKLLREFNISNPKLDIFSKNEGNK